MAVEACLRASVPPCLRVSTFLASTLSLSTTRRRSYHTAGHDRIRDDLREPRRLRSRGGFRGVSPSGTGEVGGVSPNRRRRAAGAAPVRQKPAIQPQAPARAVRRERDAVEAGGLPGLRPAGLL